VRVAIVSDIHSNLHALEAVLAAIDAEPVDELWCLGDVVGYGPRPNECCALVRSRASVCLCGNHDLAVTGALGLTEFSGDAGVAASWTRGVLDDASRDWLQALEPAAVADGAALYHGSARDPVWEYVLTDEAAIATLMLAKEPLVLVGHSHAALRVALRGIELDAGLAPNGTDLELGDARWLLNPGSVGQPRDGDPHAAFLILDRGAGTAGFRRVPYDVERTQAEMRDAGLPELLAARLGVGQ
jgi:diadenosine tetraphosphatase ApaH/serine/threonine PP2A family protein phosphatase